MNAELRFCRLMGEVSACWRDNLHAVLQQEHSTGCGLPLEASLAKPRPTIMKRKREQARQEKRRQKAARRQNRAASKPDRPDMGGDIDPDIAHIVPGPQPLPWDDEDDDDIEDSTASGPSTTTP